MIACPSCGHTNREGALFCDSCGTYLHTGGPLSTDALEGEQASKPGPSTFAPFVHGSSAANMSLVLTNVAEDRRFVLEPYEQSVLLGRTDRKAHLIVDIDLTSTDGRAHGVSRRHARVHFINGNYLIEDLESLNGTYLNERKLRPYLPEVLHDGDQIKLGNLTLGVSFAGHAGTSETGPISQV